MTVRVLLVEDSVTQREILRALIEEDLELSVVAEGRNGREGLSQALAIRPDLVVADVWMPEMNGLEMTRAILAELGLPIIIISEAFRKDGLNIAVECLAAGAVVAIEKPAGPAIVALPRMGRELRRAIREFVGVRIRRRPARTASSSNAPRVLRRDLSSGERAGAIGIVSSTGGPQALASLLRHFPAAFSVPILIVQHISPGFEEGFRQWLEDQARLPVRIPRDATPIGPGIFLAPQGRHLVLGSDRTLRFLEPGAGEFHVPSGNPLLASLADRLGGNAIGVILTGMGADGVDGLLRIQEAGGETIAQSEESSLIWGMPGEAVRRGAANWNASPDEIGESLAKLSGRAA